jgi:heat shock protein HtpX
LLSNLPFATPFAVLVALVPALYRWQWGRSLPPLAGDPAFPERLAAYRVRCGKALAVAFSLLIILFTDTLLWSAPLLALASVVASFRLRRTIHQETWGLGGYLWFIGRTIVAIFGFWILLVNLPWLAALAGPRDWIAAALMGLVLVVWNDRYTDTVRFILRARPIDNAPLIARFAALAQSSTAGMPIFEQVPLRGGAISNAIALPSLRRSAVLFTDKLLARLEADEIVAICGHELAHIEYFNQERLRRINLVNLLLIAGSLVCVALSRVTSGSLVSIGVLWPVVVIGTLAWRVRDRQQHETDSDLRAVALTGDPEALARGLIKIHAHAHLPRRMDAEIEQRATHPSLARRIQAIRAQAPSTSPATPLSATFASPDGRTQVTFGDRHLEWREGEVALHSLSYTNLSELRVDVSSRTSVQLVIVDRARQRWNIRLAESDVARAQAALDAVDCQLAPAPAPPGALPALERAFTLLAITFAVLAGQMVAAAFAAIAFFRPVPPLVAAAGGAIVAGAALALRQPDWTGLQAQPWVSLGLMAAGALLLWSAWKGREQASQTTVNRVAAATGVVGAIALIAVVSEGFDVVHLHQAARSLPAVVVLPIACAAALLCQSSARARLGATTAVLVALAMATVGAVPFLDRFGTDPLLLPSPAMTEIRLGGTPVKEFTLPFYANDVSLSPGAVAISVHDMRDNRMHEGQPTTFHIGRLDHPLILTPVVADDVVFVDDERVLTIDEDDDGVEIEERALAQLDTPAWRHQVPGVFDARLSVEGQSRRWTLVGWDRERKVVRVRGTIGQAGDETARWASPIEGPDWSTTVAASGDRALIVETRYDYQSLNALAIKRALTLMTPGATIAQVWQLAGDGSKDLGTSVLASECYGGVLGDDHIVCSAHDGTRTRMVALDAATGGITALGTFDGRFMSDRHSPSGWVTGWCDMRPCAIRLATRELMTPADRQPSVLGFATNDRWLGLLSVDGIRSRLQLFSLSK